MKKFFMIAVMAVAALTASAQQQYRITPHLGLGWLHQTKPAEIDKVTNNGFAYLVGGDFEYFVAENFGLSAGLDFLYWKSDEEKDSSVGNSAMYNTRSQLNIPVLAQYHFGICAIKAGLQPEFNLSANFHDGNGHDESQTDLMNSFTLSVPVGLSFDFKNSITLDLRATLPLSKQNKEGNFDIKQTVYMATLGYRF